MRLQWLLKFLPFLHWLPELKNKEVLRADIYAGASIAMLLIPQSMAYAKLAGLPAYYGLYAAFIPPIIAALFGSSKILSTGPVAITSLLTAAALERLQAPGSESYFSYVLLLSFSAGLIQFILGTLRLGVVLNFLSHPVILGFSNAAAIIIATAQLASLLGVPEIYFDRHYQTVLYVIKNAFYDAHLPTMIISVIALTSVYVCQKFWPRAPRILIAVLLTTLISWLTGYEKSRVILIDNIASYPVQQMLKQYVDYPEAFATITQDIQQADVNLKQTIQSEGETSKKTAEAMSQLRNAQWEMERKILEHELIKTKLNQLRLKKIKEGRQDIYIVESYLTPMTKVDSLPWRISDIREKEIVIEAGGRVLGSIPRGLPSFQSPPFQFDLFVQLFLPALLIALMGFMEATTITRYLAAESKEILDVNQELIGQGLSKMTGSFFQSMPVSGAFSRTAVNFKSGAKTGFSSIVAGLIVMLVLLFLTPLFYHLPLATLAAVVIVSALGFINFKSMFRLYKINPKEAWVAVLTFVMTLLLAPRLEYAILLGMLISLGVYLNETRHPKITVLTRLKNGEIGEASPSDETCYLINLLRFGGSLYFANTAYFENYIIGLIKQNPKLRYIIIDCISINKMDASALEMLNGLYQRLDDAGIELWFSRIRQPILHIFKASGFYTEFNKNHFQKDNESAIAVLSEHLGAKHMNQCPLATGN